MYLTEENKQEIISAFERSKLRISDFKRLINELLRIETGILKVDFLKKSPHQLIFRKVKSYRVVEIPE